MDELEFEIYASIEHKAVVFRVTDEEGELHDYIIHPVYALDIARELQNAAKQCNTLEAPGN